MNRIRFAACAVALLVPLGASAQLQAHVLIVENEGQVNSWLVAPPAQRAGNTYRMRQVPVGKKIMMPVVVTGAQSAAGEQRITADFELLAPDGKVVASAPGCCRGLVRAGDPPAPIVLQPMIDVTADPGDMPGEYSVRYTVSDGKGKVTTVEKFNLAAVPGRAPRATAGPDAKTEMKVTGPQAGPRPETSGPRPPVLQSGGSRPDDKDLRHCLGLPTQQEILKCAGNVK